MRIALMPSAFYPSLGGVEELTRQLAHELLRKGHEVLIVTERWPRNLPRAEKVDGLDVRRFPMRVPTGRPKSNATFLLTTLLVRSAIARELSRFRADVLHVQCVSSTALYALAMQRRLSLPLVVTLQGELTMDANEIFKKPGIAQTILRSAAMRAEVITGCSAKTLDDARDYLDLRAPDKPSRVVFNAASVLDFQKATPFVHDKPFIFALGRMVPQKGFDCLLTAFSQSPFRASHDLILAGDGPVLSELKVLASQLAIDDQVKFLGRANRELTCSLFMGCRLFVLPSRTDEGLPVVCAEAMAAGKPIVATKSGGTPEMILHGRNGLLVEKEDVAGLRTAIDSVLGDLSLAQRIASAAKSHSSNFSWPTIANDYVQCYEFAMFAQNR